jgi:hypothetical protein
MLFSGSFAYAMLYVLKLSRSSGYNVTLLPVLACSVPIKSTRAAAEATERFSSDYCAMFSSQG